MCVIALALPLGRINMGALLESAAKKWRQSFPTLAWRVRVFRTPGKPAPKGPAIPPDLGEYAQA